MRLSGSIINIGFCLISFSSYGQFHMNGKASQLDTACFQLTPDEFGVSGSIWYNDKIDLRKNFDLQLKINLGCHEGADGIVFGLQPKSTSVGGLGQGIGFGGIVPSLGVEFDTYQNFDFKDPAYDHIAIIKNGSCDHNTKNTLAGPISANGKDIEDCKWHTVRMIWDASTFLFKIYFDCAEKLSYKGDIVKDIFNNDPMVFWGFTSATGGERNDHRVCLTYTTFLNKMRDTTICLGTSVKLKVPGGFKYKWSPSSSLNSTNISNPVATPDTTTMYVVEMEDVCGKLFYDSINIFVKSEPPYSLGKDTDLCGGQSLLLGAQQKGKGYKWQDGSTDSTFLVTKPGKYYVDIAMNDCPKRGSINVTYSYPIPKILGDDTFFCKGESVTLKSEKSYADYLWNDGSTLPYLTVNKPGVYKVRILTSVKCNVYSFDTIVVSEIPLPELSLGADTEYCFSSPYLIIADSGFSNYQWQTGTSGRYFTTKKAGTFWVKVTNDYGCISYDTIIINDKKPAPVFIPNCFTPNGDGINDGFMPMGMDEMSSYQMMIFTKWGQLIFETENPSEKWDGKINSAVIEDGTYLYMLRGTDCHLQKHYYNGTVNLIR